MLFILKKKKEKKKKKNVSNKRGKEKKKTTAHKPILHQTGKEKKCYRKTLEARGPRFLKNFMNFLKIIFIWQQVTLKNLLSGTPDMEIQ